MQAAINDNEAFRNERKIAWARLYAAVINQALIDACQPIVVHVLGKDDRATKQNADRQEARIWLLNPHSTLEYVCERLKWDVEYVRKEAKKIINEFDQNPIKRRKQDSRWLDIVNK